MRAHKMSQLCNSSCLLQMETRTQMFCIGRGEVPFILPRSAPSAQRKHEALDGIATVLLSHVVYNVEGPASEVLTSQMNVDRQSISNRPSDDMADANDISMDDMEQTSSKASTVSSVDVPFDAHVLPGRGRRLCAILPLLCVTDEANMTSLLSSVLYQRYVWGIVDPVVGIVFSKVGTVGQVLFGWLDIDSTNDFNLVCDHVCYDAYPYRICSQLCT